MIEGVLGFKEIAKNSQNQIILPNEIREVLQKQQGEGRFYVYMQEGRCLRFSSVDEFMGNLRAVEDSFFSAFEANTLTAIFRHVLIVNMGKDGRVTLTKDMMDKVGIKADDKAVICCGTNKEIEIWAKDVFDAEIEAKAEIYRKQIEAFEKEIFKFRVPTRAETESSIAEGPPAPNRIISEND